MKNFSYGLACSLESDVPEGWPIVLRGDIDYLCKVAKGLGYDGLELQLQNPTQYNGEELKNTAKKYGLAFTALATGREQVENGLSLISADEHLRKKTIERLKEHIDLASTLDCMVVVGTLRSNIPDFSKYDYYENLMISALHELSEYANKKGVLLVIENILAAFSNYLNTIKQVADFVRKVDRDNVKVHLDTFSMLAEENSISGAINYAGDDLAYVHYSDSGRFYPGGGNINFKEFTKCLKESGYNGYITVESRPYPSKEICAELSINYVKAIEICVDIEMQSYTANR